MFTQSSSNSSHYFRYMIPGKGTCQVYPITRFSARDSAGNKRQKSSWEKSHPEEKAVEPKTVLVVEDTYVNQILANKFLTNAGYLVDIAENGVIAVDKFNNSKYDLILMDIYMPEMDGFLATEEIRKIEKQQGVKSRIPIIAFTAHAVEGYRNKCLENGMDDYITKPIKKKTFLEAVENWI